MLMLRAKPPADWLDKIRANLPAVLVDHAHLERKAATTALCMDKYKDLYPHVEELNSIAIEELQHFQLVLNLLKARRIPFGHAFPSPWISGMMKSIRKGSRHQAIDHLICCSLIEGRSSWTGKRRPEGVDAIGISTKYATVNRCRIVPS